MHHLWIPSPHIDRPIIGDALKIDNCLKKLIFLVSEHLRWWGLISLLLHEENSYDCGQKHLENRFYPPGAQIEGWSVPSVVIPNSWSEIFNSAHLRQRTVNRQFAHCKNKGLKTIPSFSSIKNVSVCRPIRLRERRHSSSSFSDVTALFATVVLGARTRSEDQPMLWLKSIEDP